MSPAITVLPLKLVSAWGPLESAGAPLVVGLATFAVVGAALGFKRVWLLFHLHPATQVDDGPPTV
jgi:hypothetical protein